MTWKRIMGSRGKVRREFTLGEEQKKGGGLLLLVQMMQTSLLVSVQATSEASRLPSSCVVRALERLGSLQLQSVPVRHPHLG